MATGEEDPSVKQKNLKKLPQTSAPFVKLDPAHPITLRQKPIQIPEPSFHLQNVLKARQEEAVEEDFDDDDQAVFAHDSSSKGKGREDDPMVIDDDEDYEDMGFEITDVQPAPRYRGSSLALAAASTTTNQSPSR